MCMRVCTYWMHLGACPICVLAVCVFVQIPPFATLECWLEPLRVAGGMLEMTNALQAQYARVLPRAKFRLMSEPTTEEVHSLRDAVRAHARDDRILFHYNGHGVPKPTPAGEVCVCLCVC